MIKTSQLNKSVKTAEADLEILRGIDLEIKRGETAAIVGTSGSGKSTLLGLLAGLDSPSGATFTSMTPILCNSMRMRGHIAEPKSGLRVPKFPIVTRTNCARERHATARACRRDDARVMAEDYLARVGLGERLHHYPRTLSGGEQQRVAIARAFAAKPLFFLRMNPRVTSIQQRAPRSLSCCSAQRGGGHDARSRNP